MKSQCCNAKIEVDKGGNGVFALTTGAYICSKCGKYCVKKQVCAFGEKIKKILKDNGYSYKVKVFPKKEGVINRAGKKVFQDYEKVVIYAGRSVETTAQKRSKRLIAWKNTKGEWEGDLETLKQFGDRNSNGEYIGNALYIRDYHDKTEPVKHTLFSDLWEENEKEFGGQERELLKIMENWKFQETERAKLDEDEHNAMRREHDEERIQAKFNDEKV